MTAVSARRDARAAASGAPRLGVGCFPPMISQNPYQRLLYEALREQGVELIPDARLKLGWLVRNRGRLDVVHLHWPETFYRHGGRFSRPLSRVKLALFATRLLAARLLGSRLVWTVHQVSPHETTDRGLDRAAARMLARVCHALLVHDEPTAAAARTVLGARQVEIVPHASYVGVYPEGRGRESVRAELGVGPDDFVFLCFGLVRAYKDVDVLLDAFRALESESVRLVVAGRVFDDELAERLRALAADDPRILLRLGFVDDADVQPLFAAADASVVARRDGGTSGALMLALSLSLPPVAADTPTYRALVGDAGWLFDPADAASFTEALAAAAADPGRARALRPAALEAASRYRWADVAQATAAVFAGEAP
jgi:glycosyltransferase involved in cell wall biosynthesis